MARGTQQYLCKAAACGPAGFGLNNSGVLPGRELGVRNAGFAVRDANKLIEMQSRCISGKET